MLLIWNGAPTRIVFLVTLLQEAVKMLSVKVQDGDIDRIQHQLSENITAKDTTSRMKHLMEQLEKLQKETSFGWDGVKDKAEERVKEVLQSLKEELADSDAVKNGATCPKNWKFIADGYDYGIGCNLGCKCPSFVDVCATSPRIGKASDLKEPQTRFSVAQLGYCRTGKCRVRVGSMMSMSLTNIKRYISK